MVGVGHSFIYLFLHITELRRVETDTLARLPFSGSLIFINDQVGLSAKKQK